MEDKERPYWLIPAGLALLIPIVAVLADAPVALSILVGASILALVAVGGGWFLMQERHKLRMREIEAEAAVLSTERDRLATAERILDKDDGVDRLRREIADPPELTN